jgi:hypothetical protein
LATIRPRLILAYVAYLEVLYLRAQDLATRGYDLLHSTDRSKPQFPSQGCIISSWSLVVYAYGVKLSGWQQPTWIGNSLSSSYRSLRPGTIRENNLCACGIPPSPYFGMLLFWRAIFMTIAPLDKPQHFISLPGSGRFGVESLVRDPQVGTGRWRSSWSPRRSH